MKCHVHITVLSATLQLSETCFLIDRRVSQKVNELAALGIRRLPEVRRQLHQFLTHDLFPGKPLPPPTDTRYWPTNKQILSCLYRAHHRMRCSSLTFTWCYECSHS